MIRKYLIAFLLIIFTNMPVFAYRWVEISYKVYIDLSSIKYEGDTANFWIKCLNNGDTEDFEKKKVWYTMANNTISCKDKIIKINAVYLYGLKGEYLSGDSAPAFYDYIIPQSISETMYDYVCQ